MERRSGSSPPGEALGPRHPQQLCKPFPPRWKEAKADLEGGPPGGRSGRNVGFYGAEEQRGRPDPGQEGAPLLSPGLLLMDADPYFDDAKEVFDVKQHLAQAPVFSYDSGGAASVCAGRAAETLLPV